MVLPFDLRKKLFVSAVTNNLLSKTKVCSSHGSGLNLGQHPVSDLSIFTFGVSLILILYIPLSHPIKLPVLALHLYLRRRFCHSIAI